MTSISSAGVAGNVYFIDSRVPDRATLLGALPAGSEWHLLDPGVDGIAQIAQVLAGRTGIGAVHLVSHGMPGGVQLGATVLSADTLSGHAAGLAVLGDALAADGDLLLYGCAAGAGADGAALVQELAALTGADVAASTGVTGNAAAGGDWVLERATGVIDAPALGSDGTLAAYAGTLGTTSLFDFTANVVADRILDGIGVPSASQTVNGNTLTVTSDAGCLVVIDDDYIIDEPDPVMNQDGVSVDYLTLAPYTLRLSLDGGKVFDLTRFSMADVAITMFNLVIKTDKGEFTLPVTPDGMGYLHVMPALAILQGVAWVELSDADTTQRMQIELDDIVLSNITHAPSFTVATTTVTAAQNGGAIDFTGLLHVSDSDAGETLTWSQGSAPGHGTLSIGGAGVASGGADIAPGGALTYAPAAGYAGTDSFTVQVSDGFTTVARTITVSVVPTQPGAPDLAGASDTGGNSGDDVTGANAMTFSGTSAAGDATSTVRVFLDADGNGLYDAGEANGTATVSNGTWTVAGIDTSALASGNYDVYAVVTSATGALDSTASGPLALTIDHTPPSTSFAAIALSNDWNVPGDFNTNVAAQTITATLSGALAAGDVVMGSLDNGGNWTDITAMVGGTSLTWTGATLVAGGGIRLRVLDVHGNAGTSTEQAYTLDAAALLTVDSAALSADNGAGAADFVTNVAAQNLSGSLSGGTAAGDTVEVSLNNGIDWLAANNTTGDDTWSLAGIVLPGSGTLQVRVKDQAGNTGIAYTQAYLVDTAAPTATLPASTGLVAPAGTTFDVKVTYGDTGGAGLDATTIGTGNITVEDTLGNALAVTGYAVNGNEVTYTVQAPGGSWGAEDVGTYLVGITATARDVAGNTVAADSKAGTIDVVYTTVPSVSGLALSADTGVSASDFLTNVANQTVTATLGKALVAGDQVWGSLDKGVTSVDITSHVSGTTVAWTGVTLAGSDTLMIWATDINGQQGAAAFHDYTLDTAVPAQAQASVALLADSGASTGDFITNVAAQDIGGTLDTALGADEFVEISFDNGASWTVAPATSASTWSLAGITLAGSGTLQVRVADEAGNHGTPWTHAYRLDTAAPTATLPASTGLVAPAGTTFDVKVTYGDTGGAGLDATTIGTANITVEDALGNLLAVTGYAVNGNEVTYTAQAPGGSWGAEDVGTYLVGITATVRDMAGNAVAADSKAGAINVVFGTAPTVSALALSADTGTSAGDFLTNVANQTVTATLGKALVAGDQVWGSLDKGLSWTDITSHVSGTAVAWTGVTLAGSDTLMIRATDINGQPGLSASHAYTLDTAAPAQALASVALSADSGASAGDFITNVAAQDIGGTLGTPLGDDEFVEVSFDNGASWTAAPGTSASAWSLAGITLAGSGTLQVRVADDAGNHGTPWTHAYLLDTAAPTAGTPVRANLVDPTGSEFTFTVTYADGGAGLDPASIGPGNVGVVGPMGALAVTGASASGNTVTYTVAAPGGSWDPLDAGSYIGNYAIAINASVKDLAGNVVAANPAAHTFTVAANSAPVIGGEFTVASIDDDATTAPFGGVTVTDVDGGPITLTIAYTGANGTLGGTGLTGSAGSYTLAGTPGDVQAQLQALVFTPTANQGTGIVATTFVLTASDGIASAANKLTTVTVSPVAPQVSSIALSDTTLTAGETATLTVTFSERVTGFTLADLDVKNGALDALSTKDDGRTWTATFTPAAATASATNQVTVDLAGVADLGGLAGSGTASMVNYSINTVRPTATILVGDTVLTAGETAQVTITFSEAVSGFDLGDVTAPNGTLSGLETGDGGVTWTATLTPAANVAAASNAFAVNLAGVANAAGNAGTGIAQSNAYAVRTLPPQPVPDTPTPIVDGMPVTMGRQVDTATGVDNQFITVPIVTATRNDDPNTPNAALADIPLAAAGGGATSTLTVGLPVGTGLQASGSAGLLTSDLAEVDLIQRIEQKTVAGSGTQLDMTREGTAFLGDLPAGTLLQTATLAPMLAPGATASSIVVSGAGAADEATAIAVVIDTTQLGSGVALQLDGIDFTAVVGQATLRGGAGGNIVIGDDASQSIFLGAGDDRLFGGGGDDTIGSAAGNDLLSGGDGNDAAAGGTGNDSLAGGAGDDVLQGGRSDRGAWSFTLSAAGTLGATHRTAMFDPAASETVALAELDQGAAGLAFLSAARGTLADVALLYHAALGRAPDIAGLNWWLAGGASPQVLASDILMSGEWAAGGDTTSSDAAFVTKLYDLVLGRTADDAGVQYWLAQMGGATPLSRADVLLQFALGSEHRAHFADGIVVASGTVTHESGWMTGGGDDRLEGGAGNDWLAGGDGLDTAVLAGNAADYRLRVLDGEHVVLTRAGEADTLAGIERGEFADGTFDLSFTQGDQIGTLGLLYQAVLDRDADLGGIGWWAGQGMSARELAATFAASAEFQARYGAMSDTAIVQTLYAVSELDATAAGGEAAWVEYLRTHDRAELIGAWIGQDSVVAAQFTTVGL